MISLATKAGKTKSGEFMTEKEVKEGRAHLVIVADDASDNTKKKFADSAAYYNKKIVIYGDKFELGKAIGKNERSVIVIKDGGFAKKIIDMIGE